MTTTAPTISFDEYSRKYDLLLEHSSPYQEIGQMILEEIKQQFEKDDLFTVLDIGGGTGNFSKLIQESFPNSEITLLDSNEKMSSIAQQKLDANRSKFISAPFETCNGKQTYDIILCIHALYLMPNPKKLIPKFKTFMHTNSTLIVCDIGKEINVKDWTLFLLKENFKNHGFRKTLDLFFLFSEIKTANRNIQSKQRSGRLWKHDLDTFRSWFEQNYIVRKAMSCYRGCSGFLVCGISEVEN